MVFFFLIFFYKTLNRLTSFCGKKITESINRMRTVLLTVPNVHQKSSGSQITAAQDWFSLQTQWHCQSCTSSCVNMMKGNMGCIATVWERAVCRHVEVCWSALLPRDLRLAAVVEDQEKFSVQLASLFLAQLSKLCNTVSGSRIW